MELNIRRYPIGIQNFEQLRNNNCVYVDKTELVYKLTHTDQVYFLSRPRRFGKSLLVSTLEAYFQGKKDLFGGLAMERLEKDWESYPVLHAAYRFQYQQIPLCPLSALRHKLVLGTVGERIRLLCGG